MKKTLVCGVCEFTKLLKNYYSSERLKIIKESYGGYISAKLDNKKFNITFEPNEYLLVFTDVESKDILEGLFPFLTEIMCGEKPICSYDLFESENYIISNIEWDIINPEKRLKEIMDGTAYPDAEIRNLKIYNNTIIDEDMNATNEKKKILV